MRGQHWLVAQLACSASCQLRQNVRGQVLDSACDGSQTEPHRALCHKYDAGLQRTTATGLMPHDHRAQQLDDAEKSAVRQGTMSGNDFARSLISALGVRHVDLYLDKVSGTFACRTAECHRLH